MKKIITLVILFCLSAVVFAHPPQSVVLSYDPATGLFSINVAHLVKAGDLEKHFVKDIALTVNDVKVINVTIAFQQAESGEKAIFFLNVKPGDKVAIKATCNVFGDKKSELVIPAPVKD